MGSKCRGVWAQSLRNVWSGSGRSWIVFNLLRQRVWNDWGCVGEVWAGPAERAGEMSKKWPEKPPLEAVDRKLGVKKVERIGKGGVEGIWLGWTGSRFCGEDRYRIVLPQDSSVFWNCVGISGLKPGHLALWLPLAWHLNVFSGQSCGICLELQKALDIT